MKFPNKIIKTPVSILILLLLSLISFLICTGNNLSNKKNKPEVLKIGNIDFKIVRDGGYIGKYNININSAEVQVFVKNGVILKIDILKHYHGPGYGADIITEDIIKKQTLEVDAVTGATKSSTVLKKAVENALMQGL
jgi:uncharacterized protein with FMN-binding domain